MSRAEGSAALSLSLILIYVHKVVSARKDLFLITPRFIRDRCCGNRFSDAAPFIR
jgi:hypothetical protein